MEPAPLVHWSAGSAPVPCDESKEGSICACRLPSSCSKSPRSTSPAARSSGSPITARHDRMTARGKGLLGRVSFFEMEKEDDILLTAAGPDAAKVLEKPGGSFSCDPPADPVQAKGEGRRINGFRKPGKASTKRRLPKIHSPPTGLRPLSCGTLCSFVPPAVRGSFCSIHSRHAPLFSPAGMSAAVSGSTIIRQDAAAWGSGNTNSPLQIRIICITMKEK